MPRYVNLVYRDRRNKIKYLKKKYSTYFRLKTKKIF